MNDDGVAMDAAVAWAKNCGRRLRACIGIGCWLLCALQGVSPLWSKPLDLSPLNQVAVQDQGRKKPLYVFATEHLREMYGRESWRDANGETVPAVNLFVDFWLRGASAEQAYWQVENLSLKEYLGLPKERNYFSYAELATVRLSKLVQEGSQVQARGEKLSALQSAAWQLNRRLTFFADGLRDGRLFRLLPNPHGVNWGTVGEANALYPAEQAARLQQVLNDFRQAFAAGDAARVQATATVLRDTLRDLAPEQYPSARMLRLELLYAQGHWFTWAWVAYLLAAIILLFTSVFWRRAGYVLGWLLAAVGLCLQITGFVLRMWIAGRAPVTNMYETVIWLGFGMVLLALVFEGIYRSRYFLLGATPIAFVSLLLAQTQDQILDNSIHPLVPVLRSNFWLSTHVLTITSSYAAFAVALGIGHIVLGKLLLHRQVSPDLYRYLYRVLQVGVLLVGVGTILGGVWANYAWGRFWDWDPKETWALITFLCYLVVLHGRIAGWWGGVGLAAGSVLCFLSVLMAWYGVNFVLGTGLHSYGFGTGGFRYVLGFVILELVFVAAALSARYRMGNGKTPAGVAD